MVCTTDPVVPTCTVVSLSSMMDPVDPIGVEESGVVLSNISITEAVVTATGVVDAGASDVISIIDAVDFATVEEGASDVSSISEAVLCAIVDDGASDVTGTVISISDAVDNAIVDAGASVNSITDAVDGSDVDGTVSSKTDAVEIDVKAEVVNSVVGEALASITDAVDAAVVDGVDGDVAADVVCVVLLADDPAVSPGTMKSTVGAVMGVACVSDVDPVTSPARRAEGSDRQV